MFFQPYTDYVITRQLYNERDFGQKYVKAWVTDAQTDEVVSSYSDNTPLTGVEMTEVDSSGKFKYQFKLPGDPTGHGRQLRIKTVVYTDSAYTEKDINYNVEETNIVVRDMNVLGGGGGGGSIDYDYLKEIIKKITKQEIDQIPPPKEIVLPDVKKIVKASQNAILEQIKAIKMPIMPEIPKIIETKVPVWNEMKEIDLKPILGQIEDSTKKIIKAVDNKKIPEPDLDKLVVPAEKIITPKIEKLLLDFFRKERIERIKDADDIMEAINELSK